MPVAAAESCQSSYRIPRREKHLLIVTTVIRRKTKQRPVIGAADSPDTLNSWVSKAAVNGGDVSKPYVQQKTSTGILREFSKDVSDWDYVWHRDAKDRTVKVLEGDGWQFQFDNEMPTRIRPGSVILIPAEMYHRLIPGTNNLKVEIQES